ncbi:MAG: amino acid adenylation domain-containing protein [Dermatophilaceae bacterium]
MTLIDALQTAAARENGFTWLGRRGLVEQEMSYRELEMRSSSLSSELLRHAAPGNRVLLLYPPSLEYLVGFVACLRAGIVAVPAYPPQGAHRSRVEAIARDCRPSVVLTTSATAASIREWCRSTGAAGEALVVLASDEEGQDSAACRLPRIGSDDVAFLQYTSGSTAEPKGVVVSHGNLVANESAIAKRFAHGPDSVVVSWLPLFHDMGLIGGALQALWLGAPAVLMAPETFLRRPLVWLEAVSRFGAHSSGGPNFAYELCVARSTPEERASLDLSTWRNAFSGAEPVRARTVARFAEAFQPAGFRPTAWLPCYGLAESTLLVSAARSGTGARILEVNGDALERKGEAVVEPGGMQLVSCGAVTDGHGLSIRASDGAPVGEGQVGEVWVTGPSVAAGYWARPEASAKTFVAAEEGRAVRTGDLGFVDSGELFVTGRIKDLIVVRGRNIAPQDLEETATAADGVRRAIAFSVEHHDEERIAVIAEINAALADPPRAEEIRATVAGVHGVPVHTVVLVRPGQIETTSSGKVRRACMRARLLAGDVPALARSPEPESVDRELPSRRPARNWSEEHGDGTTDGAPLEDVAELLSQILHRPVEVADLARSAVELGLESLQLVEVIGALEDAGYTGVTVADLLGNAPLRDVVGAVHTAQGTQGGPVSPLADPRAAPATSTQQRQWLLDQLGDGTAAAVVPVRATLTGPVDVVALRDALASVLARHAVLRIRLRLGDDGLLQEVDEQAPLPFAVHDLRALSPADRARVAVELGDELVSEPFHLDRAPLWRADLIRLTDTAAELMLVWHHTVADGWSARIFLEDLTSALAGRPLGPAAPYAYLDHAARGDRKTQDEGIAFWKGELDGAPRVMSFPLDRRRPAVRSFAAGSVRRHLGKNRTSALHHTAAALSLTPFALVTGAVAALLARWGGNDDLVVGAPFADRAAPGVATAMGPLLNTLPLRLRLEQARTFAAVASLVADTTRRSVEHGHVPFETLCEQLLDDSDPAVPPLCQVLVNHVAFGPQVRSIGSLRLEARPVLDVAAKFDVCFYLVDTETDIELVVVHNTDVIEADRAKELSDQLVLLLDAATADAGQDWTSVPLTTSRLVERTGSVTEPLPSVSAPTRGDLLARLAAHAAERGDAVAIRGTGAEISYQELHRRVDLLARRLVDAGAGPENVVAIDGSRHSDLPVAMMAALRSGGAFLVLDTAVPSERAAKVVRSVRPVCWVGTAGVPSGPVDGLDEAGVVVVNAADDAGPDWTPLGALAYGVLGSVVLTSGSAGEPQVVRGAADSLTAFLEDEEERYELGPGDRFAMLSALGHDPLQRDVLTAVWNGGTLVVPDAVDVEDPVRLVGWLARERPTVLNLTPSTVRFLATTPEAYGVADAARLVTLVGEPLDRGTAVTARELFPAARIVNLYGATETQRVLTRFDLPDVLDSATDLLPAGRPPIGAQALVLTDAGLPGGVGEVGQITLRSPRLALGYMDNAEAERAAFRPNPWRSDDADRLYLTGDRGRVAPDGGIEVLGRLDRQVQVRGFRVEPAEIEALVASHASVVECVVVPAVDAPSAESLVAFVVCAADDVPDDELRTLVARSLPPYMVPSRWVRLDYLPRGATGKVDVGQLGERLATEVADPSPHLASMAEPSTPARLSVDEMRLAMVWCEVLGVDSCGPDDGFFAVGGDSLRAARLLARIRDDLGVVVGMRDLFEQPTLRGVGRIVAERRVAPAVEGGPALAARPEDRFEPFPLNDIQEAYWVGRRSGVAGGGVASHSYSEIDGGGPGRQLDTDRFRGAWQGLVERHDMLRCVVLPDGRQQILDPAPVVDVPVHDLRGVTPDEVAAHLRVVRDRMSHLCREGTGWPLFDVEVTLLDGDRHRVHLSVDFLIADASSWGVLAPDLRALYHGEAPLASRSAVQFRDYVLAEREHRDSAGFRAAEAHWLARVEDLRDGPDLPLAVDPESLAEVRVRRRSASLPAERWRALRALAARDGITPASLLATAFVEALSGWSATDRFTLNVTTVDRRPWHPDVSRIVGDFTTITLIDVETGVTTSTLRDLATSVHRRIWEGLEHNSFSGVQVLRAAARARGGSPLRLPVVFTSKLGLDDALAMQNETAWLGERTYALSQTPQVWLDHQVSEHPETGELRYDWDVVEGLFPEGMIDAMLDAYGRLLDKLATAPDPLADRFDDFLGADQKRRRRASNDTGTRSTWGMLDGPLRAAADAGPDEVAVVTPARTLTRGEIRSKADQVAAWLSARGCGPGALVAVVMEKGWEQAVAVTGVLRAGAAYLPVNAAAPTRRVHELIALGQVRHILTQVGGVERHSLDTVSEHVTELPTVGPTGPGTGGAAPVEAVRDDLAYVIFTSGSTGKPQGVMIEHQAALNTVLDVNQRHGVGQGDRVYGISGLEFDLSVYDLFGVLGAGGALVLPDRESLRDPEAWHADLAAHAVTVWNSAPALMVMLVDWLERHDKRFPDSLRLVLLSGDWVPVDLADRIRSRAPGVRVISMGGATEASIWSIDHVVTSHLPGWPSVPYGRPMTGQRFHVVDGLWRVRPEWAVGRLAIAGAGVARGYWGDARKSRERFVDAGRLGERCYVTGDLGRFRPDGEIEFLGREDFQLKIQGFRVEPGEIEAALTTHRAIDHAVVVAEGAPGGERRLIAHLVVSPGDEHRVAEPAWAPVPLEDSLRSYLGERLPGHMVPAAFVLLPDLPVTTNGKIDRKGLPSAGSLCREGPADNADPAGPLVGEVAAIVAEVLGLPADLGPQDSFFALGGTSLSAIRLQELLAQRTGVQVAMAELFRNGTVSEIAGLVAGGGGVAGAATTPVVQPLDSARRRGEEMRRARRERR